MTTVKKPLLGAFFVSFMAAAALATVPAVLETLKTQPTPSALDIVRGKATHAFEKAFASQAPGYEQSRTGWGVADYMIFNEGRGGVVVGRDGWLFSGEEFSWPRDAEKNVRANLDYIRAIQKDLNDKNIALVVGLVPAKARIHDKKLESHKPPARRQALYDVVIRNLVDGGIIVVDLRDALKSRDDADGFLRTDTHWSQAGAARAAAKIADNARVLAGQRNIDLPLLKGGITKNPESVTHEGDLLRYIPLGPLKVLGPAPDHLATDKFEASADQNADSGVGLFDDVAIPVTLVGTSYSADARWGFADFLKSEMKTDLLNAADPGQGPFATMKAYLNSEAFKTTPPKLIVWEVPERYFPISKPEEK